MVLGNIENFKGKGLVAFIDLLGFAKEIDEKWGDTEDNPLEKLLNLKRNLPIISNESLKDFSEDKTRRYPCRLQTISDSIIVSFGFEKTLIHGDMILATMALFYTISEIWKRAIEFGFTVRGAVDIGQIFWNEKEIIGPSFINVYRLEQTHAKTSRIILSSALSKNLSEYFSRSSTLWDETILKMLRKDIDGYIIFNPHSLYSYESDKKELIERLQRLKEKAKQFNKEKYSPLLATLNSENYPLRRSDLGQY